MKKLHVEMGLYFPKNLSSTIGCLVYLYIKRLPLYYVLIGRTRTYILVSLSKVTEWLNH